MLFSGSETIWLIAMAAHVAAKTSGDSGKPHARNVGAYDPRRRSGSMPTASAPKKIHSV